MTDERKPPTPPIDQQSCGICVAFRNGECHLNPPQMVMTIPQGAATYTDPEPAWPEVEPTDWCFQWSPRQ